MNSITKTLSMFVLTTAALLSTGGCSAIGEAIDCDQLCEKVEDCLYDDLDVHVCADRCEDRVDDSALAEKLDQCTDCLDHGVSCREMADECPVCDEVRAAVVP